jgi:hypothetical protein
LKSDNPVYPPKVQDLRVVASFWWIIIIRSRVTKTSIVTPILVR